MVVVALLLASAGGGVLADPLELTPTAYVYLPLLLETGYSCPLTSTNSYGAGAAYQFDMDDPVRPAYDHADKNLALRSYDLNTDPSQKHELVDYGCDDPKAPQFATLFDPYRVPELDHLYQVHHWSWLPSPDLGTRAGVITNPPVSGIGMRTTPGETLHVPESGYEISPGNAREVIVLYADEDSVTLRYAREDSAGSPGYTLHLDNICTNPNLLALYASLDDPAGPRYVYRPPEQRPYAYSLTELAAGQVLGTARDTEVVLVIVDTGSFMDARSCNDWWQVRPGYTGRCPPP
jgi:hypothetical protein